MMKSKDGETFVATLKEVLDLAKQLPLIEKLRLIEEITPEIKQEIIATQNQSRKSLWGLCSDLGNAPSADEIDQVRCEVWADFPREDI